MRSSVLAQLGWPDMRLPIMYTMSWPERVMASEQTWPRLDFIKMGNLTFKAPDNAKYPAMQLAYAAGRMGGTMTGVLSAANEQVRRRGSGGGGGGAGVGCGAAAGALRPERPAAWLGSGRRAPSAVACSPDTPRAQPRPRTTAPCLTAPCLQAVAMFLEEKIHYLDIMKVVEACCEAHKKDFVKMPSLDEIVAADAWSRKWVEAHVNSGAFSKLVVAA